MKAFQLKIVIKNSKPPIWRRVIVPAGITFSQLSMILNQAMGWWGYHIFEFEFYHLELKIMEDIIDFAGDRFAPCDYLEASTTYIREYLEQNEWFTYTYDLGDDWQHRVTIEKIIEDYEYDYPQVIKYKGDCPLEDCGGIYGYYDCLDIISDEKNPEYEERLEWMQSQGYPNTYDMNQVNEDLKKKYFYQWGKGEKRKQSYLYEEINQGIYGLHATKKDKNKKAQIVKSRKHETEEYLKRAAELLKMRVKWEQKYQASSLYDILSDFEKEDLKDIAKEKGIRGISGCSKQTLLDKLITHMLKPEVMEQYFLCMTDAEMEAFQKAVTATAPKAKLFETDLLEKIYSAGYIGLLTDGRYVVPNDVEMIYKTFGGKEFYEKRKKRSFLLSCLRAMSLLHGIAPMSVIMDMLKADATVHMSEQEVRTEIEALPPEYAEVVVLGEMVYNKCLYPDDRGLMSAQDGKKYYIPTKEESLELGTVAYLPGSKELKKLVRFMVQQMGATQEQAEFAGMMIQTSIRGDCQMHDLYEILEDEEIVFANESQIHEFVPLLNDVWNNTRMLLNRGFTPNELHRVEMPLFPKMKGNNVISFEAVRKNKIYPNDPCPCGSGKKYKNCCKNK